VVKRKAIMFKCFNVMSPFPDGEKKPVSYCIVGDDLLFMGLTLAQCKEDVLLEYPAAIFKLDCGWVLLDEEGELLDPETQQLIEENNVPKTSGLPSDPNSGGKL
jgi:hypothetical protein